MQKNAHLLRTFFEPIDDEEDLEGQIGKIEKKDKKQSHNASSSAKNVFNSRSKPKCILIQYPIHTADGIEMIDVEVPLITLIPTGFSQVDKVDIKMDVYLSLNEQGEVDISFEKPRRKPMFHPRDKSKGKVGQINISLSPHEGADGLKLLISKYERILRSQIPN